MAPEPTENKTRSLEMAIKPNENSGSRSPEDAWKKIMESVNKLISPRLVKPCKLHENLRRHTELPESHFLQDSRMASQENVAERCDNLISWIGVWTQAWFRKNIAGMQCAANMAESVLDSYYPGRRQTPLEYPAAMSENSPELFLNYLLEVEQRLIDCVQWYQRQGRDDAVNHLYQVWVVIREVFHYVEQNPEGIAGAMRTYSGGVLPGSTRLRIPLPTRRGEKVVARAYGEASPSRCLSPFLPEDDEGPPRKKLKTERTPLPTRRGQNVDPPLNGKMACESTKQTISTSRRRLAATKSSRPTTSAPPQTTGPPVEVPPGFFYDPHRQISVPRPKGAEDLPMDRLKAKMESLRNSKLPYIAFNDKVFHQTSEPYKRNAVKEPNKGDLLTSDWNNYTSATEPCTYCAKNPGLRDTCCVAVSLEKVGTYKCVGCVKGKRGCSFNEKNPGKHYTDKEKAGYKNYLKETVGAKKQKGRGTKYAELQLGYVVPADAPDGPSSIASRSSHGAATAVTPKVPPSEGGLESKARLLQMCHRLEGELSTKALLLQMCRRLEEEPATSRRRRKVTRATE